MSEYVERDFVVRFDDMSEYEKLHRVMNEHKVTVVNVVPIKLHENISYKVGSNLSTNEWLQFLAETNTLLGY